MKAVSQISKRVTRGSMSRNFKEFERVHGYKIDPAGDMRAEIVAVIDPEIDQVTMADQGVAFIIKPTSPLAQRPNPIGYRPVGDQPAAILYEDDEIEVEATAMKTELGVLPLYYLRAPLPYTFYSDHGLVTLLCYVGFTFGSKRIYIKTPSDDWRKKSNAPFGECDVAMVRNLKLSTIKDKARELAMYKQVPPTRNEKTTAKRPVSAKSEAQEDSEKYRPGSPGYEPAPDMEKDVEEESTFTSISQQSVSSAGGHKKLIIEVVTPVNKPQPTLHDREPIVMPLISTTQQGKVMKFEDVMEMVRRGEKVVPLTRDIKITRVPSEYGRLAERVRKIRITDQSSQDRDLDLL